MTKTREISRKSGILVPSIEEVPRLSNAERQALRASLEQAQREVKAGDYDVLTPELLRAEFDAVYYEGKSDTEIDTKAARDPARKSRKP